MKYFANFKDGELVEIDTGLLSGENCVNTEVPQELYEDYKATPDKYIAGEKEIEIDVPDYETDAEGNEIQTGTHKEPVTVPYPVIDPDYEAKQLAKLKAEKHLENAQKAKQAVEQGYVEFKAAQFETNAQTVGDLTATMLLMSQTGGETYGWLSRDDKVVELSLEDFGTLGSLIANYKNAVWNVKYLAFKTAIDKAKTLKALDKVVIDYDNIGDLS